MSNKRLARRDFMKHVAAGGLGLTAGSALCNQIFDLWIAEADHGNAALNLHEMLTMGVIAAQIIPTDSVPGAREAGVVDYINRKLKETPSLRPIYQTGIRDIDNASKRKFNHPFASLVPNQQREVLKSLEKTKFFAEAWKDTVEGFIRSSVGKEVVGYPGGAQPHGYHDIAARPKGS